MRRFIGPILVGLGAFLIVAALLVRFYAYPKLAVAPTAYEGVTHLEAKDAVVFNQDPEVLKPVTTDLKISARTVGDVRSTEKAPDGVVVWINSTSIRDADDKVVQRSVEKYAFDEVTGVSVDCCDQFQETTEGDPESVEHTGQALKFPFNTEKKDYKVWDTSLKDSPTAKYVGTEDLQGLEVYKFVQEIPKTTINKRDIPAFVFGVKGKKGDKAVEAEQTYTNTRTMWVEPTTGAIVDRVEEQDQRLEWNGRKVIATKGNIEFTQEQVDKGIEDMKKQAPGLKGIQGLYPIVLGVLGLLLLLAGLFLSRGSKKKERTTGTRATTSDTTGSTTSGTRTTTLEK